MVTSAAGPKSQTVQSHGELGGEVQHCEGLCTQLMLLKCLAVVIKRPRAERAVLQAALLLINSFFKIFSKHFFSLKP